MRHRPPLAALDLGGHAGRRAHRCSPRGAVLARRRTAQAGEAGQTRCAHRRQASPRRRPTLHHPPCIPARRPPSPPRATLPASASAPRHASRAAWCAARLCRSTSPATSLTSTKTCRPASRPPPSSRPAPSADHITTSTTGQTAQVHVVGRGGRCVWEGGGAFLPGNAAWRSSRRRGKPSARHPASPAPIGRVSRRQLPHSFSPFSPAACSAVPEGERIWQLYPSHLRHSSFFKYSRATIFATKCLAITMGSCLTTTPPLSAMCAPTTMPPAQVGTAGGARGWVPMLLCADAFVCCTVLHLFVF